MIHEATIPACAIPSVYYAFITSAHWPGLAHTERLIVCLLTGATSLLFFVQGFRWRTDAPHSASLVTWVVATISINNTFAIGWLGLESAFYGQVIVQAGPGFVGMTWARFFFPDGGDPLCVCDWRFATSQCRVLVCQLHDDQWLNDTVDIDAAAVFPVSLSPEYGAAGKRTPAPGCGKNLASFPAEASQWEQLQEGIAHAERLESPGLLASGVAHDFNNLLAIIIGPASLMKERTAHSNMRGELDAIIDAGERAALLSRELLAYAGHGTTMVALLDIRREVAGVCALARSSLAPGVELRVMQLPSVVAAFWSRLDASISAPSARMRWSH